MKAFLVLLLSFAFSFSAWAEEEEEDYVSLILAHGYEAEFHLHDLTQAGYLPFGAEILSPQERTYQLKISLNEEDDSLKELTVEIGGKTNSFNPSNLPYNKDFDLNTLKIRPILGRFEEGKWGWFLTIEIEAGPFLEDCTWVEDFGLTDLTHKFRITIHLDTKEGFEPHFYDFSEDCLEN